MARFTLRAIEQPDGRYHIAITPAEHGVDVQRAYTGEEVHQLAERIHAEVRWVSAPDEIRHQPGMSHEAAPEGFAAPSDDPWGGTLSAGNED
jgi:hypothetical protein